MRDRARVGARHTLAASSCRSGSQALLSLLSATGRAQGDPRGSEVHHTEQLGKRMLVPMAEVRTSGPTGSLKLWLRNASKPGPRAEAAWRSLVTDGGPGTSAEHSLARRACLLE